MRMNCGILNKILIFSVGAAIGSVITWKLVKTKYERIAQEEIDSVKDVYSKNYGNDEEDIENIPDEQNPINEIDDKPDLSIYTAKLKEQGYLKETAKACKCSRQG